MAKPKTITAKGETVGLIPVNDLHSASTLSAMIESASVYGAMAKVRPNALQRKINKHFTRSAHMVAAMPVDRKIYVLVGDMTEGDHHGSLQVVSKVELDHVSIAISNIDHFLIESDFVVGRDELHVVAGTEAHVGSGHALEDQIGRDLDAVPYIKPDKTTMIGATPVGGWYVWPRKLITINGKRFMIQHQPPKSKGRVMHTAPNALSGYFRQYAMKCFANGWEIPHYFLGAHFHEEFEIKVAIRDIVPQAKQDYIDVQILPAWQDRTHFVNRIIPDAVATVGMIAYLIHPNGEVEKHRSIIEFGAPKYEKQ